MLDQQITVLQRCPGLASLLSAGNDEGRVDVDRIIAGRDESDGKGISSRRDGDGDGGNGEVKEGRKRRRDTRARAQGGA